MLSNFESTHENYCYKNPIVKFFLYLILPPDSIKKGLSPHGSKSVTEAAIVTCVKLCKAATYINILDSNNVIFSMVQNVIGDLKMLLFKAEKPFSRGTPFLPQDIDLLIDFFLANFRLNPHNNDTLKVI